MPQFIVYRRFSSPGLHFWRRKNTKIKGEEEKLSKMADIEN